MYSNFTLAKKYLFYLTSSLNGKGHGTHSPFVFDFILNVLNNKSKYAPDPFPERRRRVLKHDKRVIEVEDYGAGSRTGSKRMRTVDQLARSALKPRKYSQLLYRMVRHYKPGTILELGTSLGITTSYLALAAPGASITSIEGSAAIAAIAKETLKEAACGQVNVIVGNFDERLPAVLQQLPKVDFAFVDGNHRFHPTLQYFDQILEKVQENSIIVFDDIHWSREMEAAWDRIRNHERVRCSIDLFFVGIVLFDGAFREKQHFTIRF